MSLCRIKNHHSSFRNLKLKRLIWQRSVYCENECHNKIVLFIHSGRNITINMDIIQMFFFYYYFDCALPPATQHSHWWRVTPVNLSPDIISNIVIVEHFPIQITAEYSARRCEEPGEAKPEISK